MHSGGAPDFSLHCWKCKYIQARPSQLSLFCSWYTGVCLGWFGICCHRDCRPQLQQLVLLSLAIPS